MRRPQSESSKGYMQRIVLCGAHGCDTTAIVQNAKDARAKGWYRDTRGGYGWICPKCQEGDPLPVDQS